MLPNPEDTIVALSSAPGPGLRAIVRLSGAESLAHRPHHVSHGSRTFVPDKAPPLRRLASVCPAYIRRCRPTFTSSRPRGPTPARNWSKSTRSRSPPLVELLIATLLTAGARAAQPGEFTLRAFLAGKLDLPRAEAVLGVIEATDGDQLRESLAQLAGGVTRPLDGLRDDLLNLLADVEAGLDFVDEDISFVGRDDLLTRLAKGLAQLTLVHKQLESRGRGDRPFRAVLVGRPNAGKSSLFNALTGRPRMPARSSARSPARPAIILSAALDWTGVPSRAG